MHDLVTRLSGIEYEVKRNDINLIVPKIRYVLTNAGLKSNIIKAHYSSTNIVRRQVKSKLWFNKSCHSKRNNYLLKGNKGKQYRLFRKKICQKVKGS